MPIHTLSSINFFNGGQSFTAEEHLQTKEHILFNDGDQFIALNRISFLKGLMQYVHTIPIIHKETYDIIPQIVYTIVYTTDMSSDHIQMTFVYDPSVFTNYSIFEFTEMEIFPCRNGTDYRLGDLRCYTNKSLNKPIKMLSIGSTPIQCHRHYIDSLDNESLDEAQIQVVIPSILLTAQVINHRYYINIIPHTDFDWPETY